MNKLIKFHPYIILLALFLCSFYSVCFAKYNPVYKNILVFGNSITIHPINDYWWGNWGMAASARENDFVHILEKKFQTTDSSSSVTPVNIANWEIYFNSMDEYYKMVKDLKPDFIIVRLGENVTKTQIFEQEFDEFITNIVSISSARIMITGTFWPDEEKDTIMKRVAQKHGIYFLPLADLYSEDTIEKVGNKVWGDDQQQHTINRAMVAAHPSDAGMKAIADRIWSTIIFNSLPCIYDFDETNHKIYNLQGISIDKRNLSNYEGLLFIDNKKSFILQK